jgi:hypothetical protein
MVPEVFSSVNKVTFPDGVKAACCKCSKQTFVQSSHIPNFCISTAFTSTIQNAAKLPPYPGVLNTILRM